MATPKWCRTRPSAHFTAASSRAKERAARRAIARTRVLHRRAGRVRSGAKRSSNASSATATTSATARRSRRRPVRPEHGRVHLRRPRFDARRLRRDAQRHRLRRDRRLPLPRLVALRRRRLSGVSLRRRGRVLRSGGGGRRTRVPRRRIAGALRQLGRACGRSPARAAPTTRAPQSSWPLLRRWPLHVGNQTAADCATLGGKWGRRRIRVAATTTRAFTPARAARAVAPDTRARRRRPISAVPTADASSASIRRVTITTERRVRRARRAF